MKGYKYKEDMYTYSSEISSVDLTSCSPKPQLESLIPSLKLSRKLIHRIQRKPQMLILHLIPFAESKRVRRPRRILNLPPIDPALRQLRDVRLRDTLGGRPHLRDEGGPYLFLRLLCEFAEVECDVDTR
jgi:hypothetical protein